MLNYCVEIPKNALYKDALYKDACLKMSTSILLNLFKQHHFLTAFIQYGGCFYHVVMKTPQKFRIFKFRNFVDFFLTENQEHFIFNEKQKNLLLSKIHSPPGY